MSMPTCSDTFRCSSACSPFLSPIVSRTAAPKVRRDAKIAFVWDSELSDLGLEAKERYLMEVI